MKFKLKTSILFLLLLFLPYYASSQSLYGDFVKPPTDFQRGFYMGTDSGLLFFTGTGTKISNPGYSLSFFLGYDLSRILSVEGRFRAGINSGTQDAPINGGIYSYLGNGLLRVSYPIHRIFPFIDFGMGIFFVSPDYESGASKNYNIQIGYGMEYYTFQRHFSVVLRGTFTYVAGAIPNNMDFGLDLKYTF